MDACIVHLCMYISSNLSVYVSAYFYTMPSPYTCELRTWDALVGNIEVRLELLRADVDLLEPRIRYPDGAGPFPGAFVIEDVHDVNVASDISVIRLDAFADLHPPIACFRDKDDLVRQTLRLELTRRTVFTWIHITGICNVVLFSYTTYLCIFKSYQK